MFSVQNFKCPRRFFLEILIVRTRVIWVPAKPLSFFFTARNFGPPKTQIIPNITKKPCGEKKEENPNSSTAWQGLIEHVCQISGSLSKKTACTFDAYQICGNMVEPAWTGMTKAWTDQRGPFSAILNQPWFHTASQVSAGDSCTLPNLYPPFCDKLLQISVW